MTTHRTPTPDTTGRADRILDELTALGEDLRRRTGVPGIAVGVLADGREAVAGLGTTGADGGAPVTGDTVFRYCSLTKPHTATLAMVLAEQGRITLDDHAAGTPFPELTIRQLLDHTSGLEGEWPGDLLDFGTDDGALGRLVADLGRVRRFAPPGRWFGYCNPGYWMLGHLLATAGGGTFEEVLREHVLRPLGVGADLDASGVDPALLALPCRPAAPGTTTHVAHEPYDFPRVRIASGGIVGSVRDVLAFAAEHTVGGGRRLVVSEDGRRTMRTLTVSGPLPGVRQGLGWVVADTPDGGTSLRHSGSYPGFTALLAVHPEHDAAVVVLTNSDAGGPVCQALVEEAGRLVRDLPRSQVSPSATEFVSPESELRALEGPYEHPACVRLTVSALPPSVLGLAMESADGTVTEADARAVARDAFEVVDGEFAGARLAFLRADDGRVESIRLGQRLGAPLGGAR